MDIAMQEDDTITQNARAFTSDGFTMAKLLFPFSKIEETLISGTRISSDSDVKTAAVNWLNGQGRDFYQAELNNLFLRSDKCLNRFGDFVEK
ncbi:hypothetical protein AVEN_258740-1 [Araneus ventricosus]|uniref:Uncharacterized protein n=1 Tax=Araneus ventricosus TaxID=182803 RepID=A0A4Y2D0D7_ARAVE|nr:hypothetical protein AVEN_258740-1 [Araneus ventricosus]